MTQDTVRQRREAVQSHFGDAREKWRDRYGMSSAFVDHMFRRRATLAAGLLRKIADRPGQLLLDVGCGAGFQAAAAARAGWRVVGVDLTPAMIRQAADSGRGPAWVVAPAEKLPFPERRVDAVMMLGVLSYAEDPVVTLRNVRRHLRAGGHLVISWSDRPPIFARLGSALSFIPRRLSRALRRASPSESATGVDDEAKFLTEYQRRWDGRAFRELLAAGGFAVLEHRAFDFGNLRILGRAVWPTAVAVAVSRVLEAVSRAPGLRTVQRGARLHIALAAPAEHGPSEIESPTSEETE